MLGYSCGYIIVWFTLGTETTELRSGTKLVSRLTNSVSHWTQTSVSCGEVVHLVLLPKWSSQITSSFVNYSVFLLNLIPSYTGYNAILSNRLISTLFYTQIYFTTTVWNYNLQPVSLAYRLELVETASLVFSKDNKIHLSHIISLHIGL